MNKHKYGQSFIEYALLIGVVSLAFVAMYTYIERSAKANLKLMEEQVKAEPEISIRIW